MGKSVTRVWFVLLLVVVGCGTETEASVARFSFAPEGVEASVRESFQDSVDEFGIWRSTGRLADQGVVAESLGIAPTLSHRGEESDVARLGSVVLSLDRLEPSFEAFTLFIEGENGSVVPVAQAAPPESVEHGARFVFRKGQEDEVARIVAGQGAGRRLGLSATMTLQLVEGAPVPFLSVPVEASVRFPIGTFSP